MLEKLKAYKELIAIVVFFLGGFFWLQTHFPTRDDLKSEQTDLKSEIGLLNCLLEKYMTLTQLQIHGRDLEKQVQELTVQVSEFTAAAPKLALSPALTQEVEAKKADLALKRSALIKTSDDMQRISDDLARNVCKRQAP